MFNHVLIHTTLFCFCCILSVVAGKATPNRGRCTIDVVPNLSPADFLQLYYLQKPVIIPNVKISIKTKKIWKLTYLASKYGTVDVAVVTSTDMTQSRMRKSRMKLSTFVQKLRSSKLQKKQHSMDQDNADDNAEIFAFEKNPRLFEHAPELVIAANKIPIIYTQQMNRSTMNRSTIQANDWYLSIGSQHSGVHAHHHSDGWAYSFAGQKRWFFWPPRSSLPSLTHEARFPMHDWYTKHVYPKLTEMELPEECATVRGDFVYVPEGWWHSTLAESSITISIAVQSRVPVTVQGKQWKEAMKHSYMAKKEKPTTKEAQLFVQNMAHSLEQFEQIQKEQPNNAEAFHFGGTVMKRINAVQGNAVTWEGTLKELKMNEKAWTLSPRNCDCLHNYGVSLAKAKKLTRSIEMLTRAVNLCGNFQSHLQRSLESIQKIEAAQQQQQRQSDRAKGSEGETKGGTMRKSSKSHQREEDL